MQCSSLLSVICVRPCCCNQHLGSHDVNNGVSARRLSIQALDCKGCFSTVTCSWLLQDSVLYWEAFIEKEIAGFRGKLQENREAATKAAEVAAQQLLAEEEQQQARAAAKKAKKQRQKAKKAQPVSSVAEAVGSLDLEAEQAVDSSEQPSPPAASTPATSALLTDANMLQLFRCPITKVACVLVILTVLSVCGHMLRFG